MRGSEEIVWAGGESSFRLGIGELRAIEQRCDAGPAVILMRLLSGQWRVDDVYQPLRLGLVGGGMSEKDATKLMDSVLKESASIYTLAVTAADVLQRFVMWNSDDSPGELLAGAKKLEAENPR